MNTFSFFWCYYLLIISILAFKEYELDYNGGVLRHSEDHAKNVLENHGSHKFDFLREDDHEDFELADIIYLSKSGVDKDIDAYSSIDKMVFVDDHNIYRSNLTKPFPKGSDVEYVEWNDTLAWAAKDWLKQCKFYRGFGDHGNVTFLQGQNLYKGSSMLPSRPLYLWYQEYKYFSFENFTCKSPHIKYQCDHMTQMLWFDSSNIGCARKSNCWPLKPLERMVNCHYFHAGNNWKIGTQIYKYGWQCTRCNLSNGNLCFNGLCVDKRICKAYNLDCKCKVECRNCVKPNYKKCRCEACKSGWDWKDCSFPCVDLYDMHANKQGFCRWKLQDAFRKLCQYNEVSNMCRRSCHNCKPLNLSDTESLCCNGKKCPPFHVLDAKCNCKKDCPSNLCLYPPSTTRYPLVLKPTISNNVSLVNKTVIPPNKVTENSTTSSISSITMQPFVPHTKISIKIESFNKTIIPSNKIKEISKASHTFAVHLALILFIGSMLLLFR